MIGPGVALAIMATLEQRRKVRADEMLRSVERSAPKSLFTPQDEPTSIADLPDSGLPSLIYPASLARVFPVTVSSELSARNPNGTSTGRRTA